ncbi:HNH endonuclease [Chryseobacterium sp. APV1]|uniref:HNH endonuclease n=1 Tax=Chryseobacterium urinae TaxID=3058400 RepID=A0ABT8TZ47_9FLAO|nr:HNH endonuclease [Chryseobacterium sp. APV1]MDO3424038.1 HNH endonuclease [Chryseobacterium sp. APV1]
MKNLKAFSKICINFFDEVVSSKKNSIKDPDYKRRISLLKPNIGKCYDVYNKNFKNNTLLIVKSFGYVNPQKDDLIKLYSYRNSKIQELKKNVTTTKYNRLINTCQNCTINEAKTLDHILPKDDFPEFSVHPQNLFPSCSVCNGHKSTNWVKSGKPLFLNLYLDPLPADQYLFVKINIDLRKKKIITKFNLENKSKIDVDLFNVIKSHYSKLHLLDRFSDNCDDTISELKNTCKSGLEEGLTLDKIISIVQKKCVKDREHLGVNHWKIILTEKLITEPKFFKLI